MRLTCPTCGGSGTERGVTHAADCRMAGHVIDPPRVRCATPGCSVELLTDPRHVDNLTAAGWRCRDHQRDHKETPC